MKKLPLLLTVAVLFACNEKKEVKPHEVDKASWFLGEWSDTTSQGLMLENWEKVNDSVFAGEAYFIKKKDTLFRETVELKEVKGVLNYIATTPDQNAGKPVSFALTKSTVDSLLFENPTHDYPKAILYRKINNDSIVATISGIQQGKESSEVFPFKRKK